MKTWSSAVPVVILAASLVASTARAQAPAPPTDTVEEARVHYHRGLELFDDGDFKLALVELERAYVLAPTYKLLFDIGQVHYQLNDYAKARGALERYLAEGKEDVPADRREQVEHDLATLRSRTARVTLRANVSGAE